MGAGLLVAGVCGMGRGRRCGEIIHAQQRMDPQRVVLHFRLVIDLDLDLLGG
jgi:hypothetical protein